MKLALAACAFAVQLFAQDILIDELRRHPQPPFSAIQLVSYQAHIEIEGLWAETRLDLRFHNPNSQRLEGTFVLPIPRHAQVDRVTLDINGKATPAELLQADKARDIYESIVRRMKDPALVEYVDSDLIRARVFPFEPRSERRLSVTYRTLLESDYGMRRYTLPIKRSSTAPATIEGRVLRSGIDHLTSPTHPLKLTQASDHWAFSTGSDRPHEFELLAQTTSDQMRISAQFHQENADSGWVMLRISPPSAIETVSKNPKDIVFVVDSSGSMAGDKLKQVQAALVFCLQALNPDDRFQIVRFATEAESLATEWVANNSANVLRATQFVKDFQAIGGTHIEEALALTAQLPRDPKRPQLVLFMTDGKPTIGARDESVLLATMKAGQRRFFTLGVGYDVNTHLLDRMSEQSKGFRTYVRPEEDLEIKLSSLYQKIQSPVMTQLKLSAKGMRLSAQVPQQLPDLFHGSEIQVLAKFMGQGKASVELTGLIMGQTERCRIEIMIPSKPVQAPYLAKIWAQRRVGYLLDEIRLHGESAEVKDEIIRLAKAWGILTPYTSFLILEDEEEQSASTDPPVRRLFEPEPSVRREWKKSYSQLSASSGEGSVNASKTTREMADGDADYDRRPPIQTQHPTHWVAGRMFVQERDHWFEQTQPPIQVERAQHIQFASAKYFELLNDNPHLAAILKLGNVVFLWQGQTVVIDGP